jgi:hypothetical protein
MPFTGQLGTANSQLGRLQLGKGPMTSLPRLIALTGSVGTALAQTGQSGTALAIPGRSNTAINLTGSV